MRIVSPGLLVALVLVAMAAVSLPQPAPAADAGGAPATQGRVLLAQNSGPNLFVLLQDIQRLQEQVRRLRGKIQMLEHQIQRNRQIRKRMYQKLDQRLTALEQGGVAETDKQAVKKAYLAAFEKLRNGKYNAAISGFEAFVEKYPNSSYTDNAWYWLGQARYVQGNLGGAMEALQVVTSQFPESSKMPSTLFRMGVIEQTQGKIDSARTTFQRIISEYPDSESADMARQRLQKLGG